MNRSERAAEIIAKELANGRERTAEQLLIALERRGIQPFYFEYGKRVIRDRYGDDYLMFRRHDASPYITIYALNPGREEARRYTLEMARGDLTRARHIEHGLGYLARHFGDRGAMRRAKRSARNTREELEELVDALASNGTP